MSSKHPTTVLTLKAFAFIEALHILGIFSEILAKQTPDWLKALVEDYHSLSVLLAGAILGFLARSLATKLWQKLFHQKQFADLVIGAIPPDVIQSHAKRLGKSDTEPAVNDKSNPSPDRDLDSN